MLCPVCYYDLMAGIIAQIEAFAQNTWVLKILSCLIILLVVYIVSRLVTRFLRSVIKSNREVLPTGSILVNVARALIWFIGICIILDTCFGVNVSALVTALGVGGIALSLGFQDTIANLIGGLQLSLMRLVKPGDEIRVGTDCGVVKDICWRHTSITTKEGEIVIIPNSVINKAALARKEGPPAAGKEPSARGSGKPG